MSPKDSTAMTETEILARLRTFLQETFLYMKPDFVLSDDDSLLQTGIVDSMGVMEVLGFIDETFGVEPADDEVTETNLGTSRAIARFVAAKLGVPHTI